MAQMAETPEVGLLKEDCASQISTTGQVAIAVRMLHTPLPPSHPWRL